MESRRSFYKLYLENRDDAENKIVPIDQAAFDKDKELKTPPKISLKPQTKIRPNANKGVMDMMRQNDEKMLNKKIDKATENRIRHERLKMQNSFVDDSPVDVQNIFTEEGTQKSPSFMSESRRKELPLDRREKLIGEMIDSDDNHPLITAMRYHNNKTRESRLEENDYYEELRNGKVTNVPRFLRTLQYELKRRSGFGYEKPDKKRAWAKEFYENNIAGKDLNYSQLEELIKSQTFNYDELGFDFNTGEPSGHGNPISFNYDRLDKLKEMGEEEYLKGPGKWEANYYGRGDDNQIYQLLNQIENGKPDEELIKMNPNLQMHQTVNRGATNLFDNYIWPNFNLDSGIGSEIYGSGVIDHILDDFFENNAKHLSPIQEKLNNGGVDDMNNKLFNLLSTFNKIRYHDMVGREDSDSFFKGIDSSLDSLKRSGKQGYNGSTYTGYLNNMDLYTDDEVQPKHIQDIEDLSKYNELITLDDSDQLDPSNIFGNNRNDSRNIFEAMRNMNVLNEFFTENPNVNIREFFQGKSEPLDKLANPDDYTNTYSTQDEKERFERNEDQDEFDRFRRSYELMDRLHIFENMIKPDLKEGDIIRKEAPDDGEKQRMIRAAMEAGKKQIPIPIDDLFHDRLGLEDLEDLDDYAYGEMRDGKITPPNFYHKPEDESEWMEWVANNIFDEFDSQLDGYVKDGIMPAGEDLAYNLEEDDIWNLIGDSEDVVDFARENFGMEGKEKQIANRQYVYENLRDKIVRSELEQFQEEGEGFQTLFDRYLPMRHDMKKVDNFITSSFAPATEDELPYNSQEYTDFIDATDKHVHEDLDEYDLYDKLTKVQKWMKENDVNGLELLKDIIQYYKDNDGKIEFPTID